MLTGDAPLLMLSTGWIDFDRTSGLRELAEIGAEGDVRVRFERPFGDLRRLIVAAKLALPQLPLALGDIAEAQQEK